VFDGWNGTGVRGVSHGALNRRCSNVAAHR
jgi:hypothetical protein